MPGSRKEQRCGLGAASLLRGSISSRALEDAHIATYIHRLKNTVPLFWRGRFIEELLHLRSQLRHVFLWSRMLALTTPPSMYGDRRVVPLLLGSGRVTCDSCACASRWVGVRSMTRQIGRNPMTPPSEGESTSQESPLERQPPLTST